MLRIYLLGSFRVCSGAGSVQRFASPKVEALFAYLLLNRDRLSPRSVLADLFWAGAREAHARDSLNTSVSRLRRALARHGASPACLVAEPGFVGVDDSRRPWLDVAEFEQAQRRCDRPELSGEERLAELHRADGLYGGALLDGAYDDWCIAERERLERLHVKILERLMGQLAQMGMPSEALLVGDRILTTDPLREDVHREMMRLHFATGDRVAACRQYRRLERLLQRELGIAPMPETRRLHAEIARWGLADTELDPQAGAQVEDVLRAVEDLRGQLAAVLSRVEAGKSRRDGGRGRGLPQSV